MKGEKGMPGVGQKVIIIIITHISLTECACLYETGVFINTLIKLIIEF